jgi:hypothetical protein
VAAGGLEAAAGAAPGEERRQGRLVEVDGAEQRPGGELALRRPGEVGGAAAGEQGEDRAGEQASPAR